MDDNVQIYPKLSGQTPELNKIIQLSVTSNRALDLINLNIFSKGVLVHNEIKQYREGGIFFDVKVTKDMLSHFTASVFA